MSNAQSLWLGGSGLDARALVSEEVLGADMRAGTVTQTGRDLDIAMQGDALLVVQAENGDEACTRRGDLRLCDLALRLRRSEEHTSELQSLMRISYAVFCLKKKTHTQHQLVNK